MSALGLVLLWLGGFTVGISVGYYLWRARHARIVDGEVLTLAGSVGMAEGIILRIDERDYVRVVAVVSPSRVIVERL